MNFFVIGVNHKTAPVEVRERFAIPESRLPEATKMLANYPGIEEGMIVSTCNRVEMMARSTNGTVDMRGFLKALYNIEPGQYEQFRSEEHTSELQSLRH